MRVVFVRAAAELGSVHRRAPDKVLLYASRLFTRSEYSALRGKLMIRIGGDRSARSFKGPKGLILDLCVPSQHAEEASYHLLGRYEHWVGKHGIRKARLIFATQSIGCVLSFWTDWLLQRVKLLQLMRRS
jgi:hypothetical protein